MSPTSARRHPRRLWRNGVEVNGSAEDRPPGNPSENPHSFFWGSDEDRPAEGSTSSESSIPAEQRCLEYCPICRTADLIRATAPPELQQYLQHWQRDALLMMRALIDHYIERVGKEPSEPVSEDIPIT